MMGNVMPVEYGPAVMVGKLTVVRVVQGDCETVYVLGDALISELWFNKDVVLPA